MLLFHGTNSNGTHEMGRTSYLPLPFVQMKLRSGWSAVEIFDGSEPDNVLGQIYKSETGERRWWASR